MIYYQKLNDINNDGHGAILLYFIALNKLVNELSYQLMLMFILRMFSVLIFLVLGGLKKF